MKKITPKTTSKPSAAAASKRPAATRTVSRAPKKSNDNNLHLAIIAIAVIAGLVVAACSANIGGRQLRNAPPTPPPVIEEPMQLEVFDATGSGYDAGLGNGEVQGATTMSVDEELNAIDYAMFSPESELDADATEVEVNQVVAP